jgi:superfamily II DNA helicase RecQ
VTKYDAIIEEAGRWYGYNALKDKQKVVVSAFLMGNDVLACLPTGYGKSVCYAILPKIFDKLRGKPKSSIVICISPLIAIMDEQNKKFQNLEITAEYISEKYRV